MATPLPDPIAAYVAANARLDREGMLAPFAPDAVVHDDGGRHVGRDEIRAWIEAATVGVRAIFTPDAWRREGDRVVVEGPTHGDFPGSPIRFRFRFQLDADAIKAVEIANADA